jgi:hypothetical protein
MSGNVFSAAPSCSVAIYPYENGQYTLQPGMGGLLNVTVTNTVRGLGGGFTLDFAPGGPNGPNSNPNWSDVLTPMSLVVIGMQRGGVSNITMIGVITSTTEIEQRSIQGVQRGTQVQGQDFSYFFQTFTFYNLFTLTGIGPAALGAVQSLATLSSDLTAGTPAHVGLSWYNKIMVPLLYNVTIMLQNSGSGSSATFAQVMGTTFEEYDTPVSIPTGVTFVSEGANWEQNFANYFPFPFYEMFLVSAPVGTYSSLSNNTNAATPITLSGFLDASPQFVCRVNPLPTLQNNGTNEKPDLQASLTKWNALTRYQPDNYGPLQIQLSYSMQEVANLFIINATAALQLFGQSNQSINPFNLTYGAWVDAASISRYGYRPSVHELKWWYDANGTQAQQNAANGTTEEQFSALIDAVNLRAAAYSEPTPLMAFGNASILLRPDILPGNVFQCAPYKDNNTWDFYIESVTHSFMFGQRATTTMTISRGMPDSVYSDQNLMTQILTGNAARVNGNIVTPTTSSGKTLTSLNIQNAVPTIASISPLFGTPQANAASNPP